MLHITWSLSLFVAKSAKKLIVFAILPGAGGCPGVPPTPVFLLLRQLFCSLLYNITGIVRGNLQAELPFAAWDLIRRC